jgi:hypothetical protein
MPYGPGHTWYTSEFLPREFKELFVEELFVDADDFALVHEVFRVVQDPIVKVTHPFVANQMIGANANLRTNQDQINMSVNKRVPSSSLWQCVDHKNMNE